MFQIVKGLGRAVPKTASAIHKAVLPLRISCAGAGENMAMKTEGGRGRVACDCQSDLTTHRYVSLVLNMKTLSGRTDEHGTVAIEMPLVGFRTKGDDQWSNAHTHRGKNGQGNIIDAQRLKIHHQLEGIQYQECARCRYS